MRIREQKIEIINPGTLIPAVRDRFEMGWRLVQITCARISDTYEITYSFDKDLVLEHLRLIITTEEAITGISSISCIYLAAFVYENEIADLYGIPIAGMAIDYKGNFIKTSIPHPFKGTVTVKKGGEE